MKTTSWLLRNLLGRKTLIDSNRGNRGIREVFASLIQGDMARQLDTARILPIRKDLFYGPVRIAWRSVRFGRRQSR